MPDPSIYVLTIRGVYINGVVGVFDSEETAREAAGKIYPESDGYHSYDILRTTLGRVHVPDRVRGWASDDDATRARKRQNYPILVDVLDLADQDR